MTTLTTRGVVAAIERSFNGNRRGHVNTTAQPPLPLAAKTEPPAQTPSQLAASIPEAAADAAAVAEPSLPSAITLDGKPLTLNLLFKILTYRRCHGSDGEKAFIDQLLLPTLKESKYDFVAIGPNGKPDEQNFCVVVPKADGTESDTMFSCHIDTCHSERDKKIKQNLFLDVSMEHVYLAKNEDSACLGGDDGAGVWILLEMIRLGVPGTYMFHRGEETGCVGKFKRAIAFDRKDTCDVITHQRSQRCCSEKFAMELASELSRFVDLTYKPSPNGAYTDTANYTRAIPECTNLSVGYEFAHGANEYVDFAHLQALLVACASIEWDKLPVDRDPAKTEYDAFRGYQGSGYQGSGGYRGHGGYTPAGQQGGFGGTGLDGVDDDYDRYGSFRTGAAPSPAPAPAPTAEAPAPAPKPAPEVNRRDLRTQQLQTKGHRYETMEPVYGLNADDFGGDTAESIMQWVVDHEGEPAAIVDTINNLLEEIEALRASLKFRRNLVSFGAN
jgi:hypothetical protein